MPPESRLERNVIVVAGAVILAAAGIFMFAQRPSYSLPGQAAGQEQQPVTLQQKQQLLQSAAAPSAAAGATSTSASTAEHAKILQSAQTPSSASQPQMSQEEKMKLLQSGQ